MTSVTLRCEAQLSDQATERVKMALSNVWYEMYEEKIVSSLSHCIEVGNYWGFPSEEALGNALAPTELDESEELDKPFGAQPRLLRAQPSLQELDKLFGAQPSLLRAQPSLHEPDDPVLTASSELDQPCDESNERLDGNCRLVSSLLTEKSSDDCWNSQFTEGCEPLWG